MMVLAHRCEPDPAIAEKDGRDTVPRRGCEDRVPCRLPVIMGVHIDSARRDQQTVGVDHPATRPGFAAGHSNPLAVDRDIPTEGRAAGPVNDRAAAK